MLMGNYIHECNVSIRVMEPEKPEHSIGINHLTVVPQNFEPQTNESANTE